MCTYILVLLYICIYMFVHMNTYVVDIYMARDGGQQRRVKALLLRERRARRATRQPGTRPTYTYRCIHIYTYILIYICIYMCV